MKKLLTAILILALSALPLGCAGAEAADSPIERMLSDWTAWHTHRTTSFLNRTLRSN